MSTEAPTERSCSTCGHRLCPGRFDGAPACWATRGLEVVDISTAGEPKYQFILVPKGHEARCVIDTWSKGKSSGQT